MSIRTFNFGLTKTIQHNFGDLFNGKYLKLKEKCFLGFNNDLVEFDPSDWTLGKAFAIPILEITEINNKLILARTTLDLKLIDINAFIMIR